MEYHRKSRDSCQDSVHARAGRHRHCCPSVVCISSLGVLYHRDSRDQERRPHHSAAVEILCKKPWRCSNISLDRPWPPPTLKVSSPKSISNNKPHLSQSLPSQSLSSTNNNPPAPPHNASLMPHQPTRPPDPTSHPLPSKQTSSTTATSFPNYASATPSKSPRNAT